MPIVLLVVLFLLVAVIYASVGFGGGSSYSALLVLSGTSYLSIPAISLSCNILVVSGGAYHFHRAGLLDLKALLPFVLLSVPMAWLGGRLPIGEMVFVSMLGLVLLVSGVQLISGSFRQIQKKPRHRVNVWLVGLPLGGLAGLIAGMVGIGGGIFLAPVLHFMAWSGPRKIAALSCGFILVNSVAGLSGQLMKQGQWSPTDDWLASWPLFGAVLVGGQLGSRLGIHVLPEKWIKRATGLLIIYVAIRLLAVWLSAS